jgi:hypothetical protein
MDVCIKCAANAVKSRVCKNQMCKKKICRPGKCWQTENMDTPDAVYKRKMRKVAETARFAGGESKIS